MRQQGFTVLELLVVILIAGIVTAIGIPSIRAMYINGQRSDSSTSLYGAFTMARSEAVARSTWVLVCPRISTASASPTATPTCQDPNSGSPDWSQGWVAFRSTSASLASAGLPAASDLIAAGDPMNANLTVVATNSSNPSVPVTSVGFNLSGNASNASGGSQAYTFQLCQTTTSSGGTKSVVHSPTGGRTIYIDFGGRVSLATSAC